MKRILIILSLVLVSFALFSCGSDDSDEVTQDQWVSTVGELKKMVDREQAATITATDGKYDFVEIKIDENDDMFFPGETIIVGGPYYLERTKNGKNCYATYKDEKFDKFVYSKDYPETQPYYPGVWAEKCGEGSVIYAISTNKESDNFKKENWGLYYNAEGVNEDWVSTIPDNNIDKQTPIRILINQYINSINLAKANVPTSLTDGEYKVTFNEQVNLGIAFAKSAEIKFDKKDDNDIRLESIKFNIVSATEPNKELDSIEVSFKYSRGKEVKFIEDNDYWPTFKLAD